jgi:hypothetical protein
MALSPTANQSARPNPAFSNAQHATGNSSPPRGAGGKFLSGKGIPTSGGRSDDKQGTSDHRNDQGSKKLYLGKAFENAHRPTFTKVKGNSKGKNEILPNHESNTVVKKAANQRLVSRDKRDTQAKGAVKPFAGIPFRRSSPAFGPRGKNAPVHEHESAVKF